MTRSRTKTIRMTARVRTGQEPAIRAVTADIVRLRTESRAVEELAPVGSSASNWSAERAAREVVSMGRVLRAA